MANVPPKPDQPTSNPPRSRWTGFYIERKWYCNCPLKAICLTAKQSNRAGELFWRCPNRNDVNQAKTTDEPRPKQCNFFVWQEDQAEAILYLQQQATPVPPALSELIEQLRAATPKTPSKRKADMSITPWTIAKRKSLSRETSGESQKSDSGEGKAPPKAGQVVMDLTSSEDESDGRPAKRLRFSSSSPVIGGAPRKERVEYHTPMGSPDISTPSRSPRRELGSPVRELGSPVRELGAFVTDLGTPGMRRVGERAGGWRDEPQASLPTPETGNRTQGTDKGKGKEVLPFATVLQFPINQDNSYSDSDTPDNTPSSPSHQAKHRKIAKMKGKNKRKETPTETPQDLTSAIFEILRGEGHVLKESTRMMIEHEVWLAMNMKDASMNAEMAVLDTKLKGSERTIGKLMGRVDELGEWVDLLTKGAGVDEEVDLSE